MKILLAFVITLTAMPMTSSASGQTIDQCDHGDPIFDNYLLEINGVETQEETTPLEREVCAETLCTLFPALTNNEISSHLSYCDLTPVVCGDEQIH